MSDNLTGLAKCQRDGHRWVSITTNGKYYFQCLYCGDVDYPPRFGPGREPDQPVQSPAPAPEPAPLTLKFKRLHPDARPPTKAHATDAGFDLATVDQFILAPGDFAWVRTGLAMEIPPGYCGLIRDRSGMGGHGIGVLGGVIDASFRGEILVILVNHSELDKRISKGDRIAQMLLIEVPKVEVVEVDSLSASDRGDGGFGSTGR